jgi:asparagine synthase (glutamine-hydrolysing)
MKVDKMTMANNLESRAPFLDPELVKFGLGLPQNMKIRGLQGKYVLKKMAELFFPKMFVWRPKHGFSVPLDHWFKKELKDLVRDSRQSVNKYPKLFNSDYYKKVVDDHWEGRANNADKIWSMIVVIKWLEFNRF